MMIHCLGYIALHVSRVSLKSFFGHKITLNTFSCRTYTSDGLKTYGLLCQ